MAGVGAGLVAQDDRHWGTACHTHVGWGCWGKDMRGCWYYYTR